MWHKVNFISGVKQVLIQSSFSQTGCHTKIKEPSLPYHLPMAGGRIVGCLSFPRLLAQCKMLNNLIQDLNSGHHVHFFSQEPLYCQILVIKYIFAHLCKEICLSTFKILLYPKYTLMHKQTERDWNRYKVQKQN